MNPDPHFLATLVVTMGVGYVMLTAGLGKNALELRRQRRICPSCGRQVEHGACTCAD